MSAATLGRRAALELDLQAAQRDLAEAIARQRAELTRADAIGAPSCSSIALNAEAARYRLRAFSIGFDVAAHRQEVKRIEAQLRYCDEPAPVLTAGQVEGMDSTMDFAQEVA